MLRFTNKRAISHLTKFKIKKNAVAYVVLALIQIICFMSMFKNAKLYAKELSRIIEATSKYS